MLMPAMDGVAESRFSGASGDAEHFIAIAASPQGSFADQLAELDGRYREILEDLGLDRKTAILRRFFVSDVINQAGPLGRSALAEPPADDPVAISLVQQAPLNGAKLAMLAYHIDSTAFVGKQRLSRNHLLVEKRGLQHLWSTRLCAGDVDGATTAAAQTRWIFDDLIGALETQGGTLRDDCIRTWIYMKDVDVCYPDMVDSRRELFARHGMNGHTHAIAGTGIEGSCAHRHDLVAIDAYSILGLDRAQVSYLNDFARLGPTRHCGITFERGTRVAYADRAHLFLSGTTSTDQAGQVVHPGHVLRQLDRALENVDALLSAGDARPSDLQYLTVYLRDPWDHAPVRDYLAQHVRDVPVVIVEGAMCRPEWLVEIEGVAVADHREPRLPAF